MKIISEIPDELDSLSVQCFRAWELGLEAMKQGEASEDEVKVALDNAFALRYLASLLRSIADTNLPIQTKGGDE